LEKLSQTAMADPSIDLFYGLALAATGQRDATKSNIQKGFNSARLFPEEEVLAAALWSHERQIEVVNPRLSR